MNNIVLKDYHTFEDGFNQYRDDAKYFEDSMYDISQNVSELTESIELIENSEHLKAGVQSRAESLADGIVPYSFLGFGLVYLLTGNITKAVSLLMVDYSCAIKLSAPIAVISAMKEAADRNITVKGGKYLEEFALADTVVFDKTGTLTNAKPKLEHVISMSSLSEDEILRISACLEEHFPHSVARAIVAGAAEKGLVHEEEHAEVESWKAERSGSACEVQSSCNI